MKKSDNKYLTSNELDEKMRAPMPNVLEVQKLQDAFRNYIMIASAGVDTEDKTQRLYEAWRQVLEEKSALPFDLQRQFEKSPPQLKNAFDIGWSGHITPDEMIKLIPVAKLEIQALKMLENVLVENQGQLSESENINTDIHAYNFKK